MTSAWKLTYRKFDPEQESLREALCTLGNGYFGTRGATPETAASRVHYPGTYIAGVYNTLPSNVAGRTIYNEDFVNCPNWLAFNYRIDNGPWFDRLKVKLLSWSKVLDIKKGMLIRKIRWQDSEGRITVVENQRIVSMAHPHCAAMRCTITPENYSGTITIRSGIDGLVQNEGVDRYKQLNSNHLIPSDHGSFGKDGIFLQMMTNQSQIKITEAQRTIAYRNHVKMRPKFKVISHGRQRIMHEMKVKLKKGERLTVQKLVSIYTSRDHGVTNDCDIAQETVGSIKDFDHLYQPHQAKWAALWKRFDVEIKGDKFVQFALRFHAFHLLQTASTYNEEIDAGLPARGLHGEAYRGHIFWDEVYSFPFYNLHAPEITRALLMYRYRRLGPAKENAKHHGYKGAMYPWQTASLGDEQTQVIHLNPMSGTWGPDYSSLQRHVNIAIAYNIWTYYYMTADRDFLDRYGSEMIVEIAHFWSSIAQFNKKTKKYDIEGVMGPDEFHEKYPGSHKGGIKNNAYTNVMAVWVLEKALHVLDQMHTEEDRKALLVKTGIDESEIKRWRDIITKMAIPMTKKGIIEQFEGYMDLKELDWDDYRARYGNIHRVDRILKSEGQSPDSYKVAKQADVLMMFYLLNFDELKGIFKRLGHPFTRKIMRDNYKYYFPRTSHGSTLSMVVHAHVADLVGDRHGAMGSFVHALKSDLEDTQGGTTQEGIHVGVMGSSIDLFLRSFAGLTIINERVCIEPKMPYGWTSAKFSVRFKNVWFHLKVTQRSVQILADFVEETAMIQNAEIPVVICGKEHSIKVGKAFKISYKK